MKETGRLHAPSTLTQEKQPNVPIVQEGLVGPGPVWTGAEPSRAEKKFLVLCREFNNSLVVQPVA